MATPLQGIIISNNFGPTRDEFEKLMIYINGSLKEPIALTLNIETMQNQLKQVTDDLSKLKDQMNATTSDKPLLNSTATVNQGKEIKQTIDQIKEQLLSLKDVTTVKINSSDINQATKDMNSFTATVTKATGEIEKLKYAQSGQMDSESRNGMATPIYSQSKITGVTDNTQAFEAKQLQTEENALIEREDSLLTDAIALTKQDLDLQQQIKVAMDSGNVPYQERLTLLEKGIALDLEQAKANLGNSSQDSQLALLKSEFDVKSTIATQNSKIEGQEEATTAEVQRRIGLYQQQKDLQVATMQAKYGESIDTASLDKAISDYRELGSSGITSLTELTAKQQEVNMSLKEIGAEAKTTADALVSASGDVGIFSKALSSIGAMAPMMLGVSAVMAVAGAFKSGVSSALELNSTLSVLQITMGGTQKSLVAMTTQMQATAIQTGSNMTDVENAVKTYANASETAQTALDKAKSAIMLSNVTGLDSKETTDSIKCGWR